MADSKPAKESKPIMDVAHPGKSAPHSNSKPIIVTNRPIMEDPMVVKDKPKPGELPPLSAPILPSFDKPSKSAKVIKPISAPEPEVPQEEAKVEEPAPKEEKKPELKPKKTKTKSIELEPEPAPEKSEPEEPKLEAPINLDDKKPAKDPVPDPVKAALAPAPKPEPEEKSEPEEPKKEPEGAAPESKEEKPEPKLEPEKPDEDKTETEEKPDDEKLKEKAPAKSEASNSDGIEEMIASKKYELPINAVEKRRSRRVVIAGIILSLLLAAAWFNIALDAELLEIDGIKSLTNFF